MLPQNDNKFNYGGYGCLSTRNCSSTCYSRRVIGILSVMCLFVMRLRTHTLTNNVSVVFVSTVNSSVDVLSCLGDGAYKRTLAVNRKK